jgi:hypothetical protein
MWARAPWRAMNVLAIVLAVVLLTAPWPWRPVFGLLALAALAATSLSLRLVRPPDIKSSVGTVQISGRPSNSARHPTAGSLRSPRGE